MKQVRDRFVTFELHIPVVFEEGSFTNEDLWQRKQLIDKIVGDMDVYNDDEFF